MHKLTEIEPERELPGALKLPKSLRLRGWLRHTKEKFNTRQKPQQMTDISSIQLH